MERIQFTDCFLFQVSKKKLQKQKMAASRSEGGM